MNKNQKKRCNQLALQFYRMYGYRQEEDYDFSEAHHPQEIAVWNQALMAHDMLKGTNLLPYNYINSRERLLERFGDE